MFGRIGAVFPRKPKHRFLSFLLIVFIGAHSSEQDLLSPPALCAGLAGDSGVIERSAGFVVVIKPTPQSWALMFGDSPGNGSGLPREGWLPLGVAHGAGQGNPLSQNCLYSA